MGWPSKKGKVRLGVDKARCTRYSSCQTGFVSMKVNDQNKNYFISTFFVFSKESPHKQVLLKTVGLFMDR